MASSSSQSQLRRTADAMSQNGFLASLTRFWKRSYVSAYVAFSLILAAYILTLAFVVPFHRLFTLDNISIQYPHADMERVPVGWLFIYAGLIPLLVIALWVLIYRPGVHQAHVTVLGFLVSLILTSFLTDTMKNAVGRPRPDLIARCKPEPGTPEHVLVTYKVCTETNHHLLHDGWRSFPSGHSSFAFSGLGFLTLFLSGQFHVFQPKADLLCFVLAMVPLLGAALIATSRCADYRHDVWDVTAGSAIGMVVAYLIYRRYYPSLRSRRCDVAYPSKEFEYKNGFARLKDDEERVQSANDSEIGDQGDDGESGALARDRR